MSEFAFFRFMSNNMLTKEEEEHKEEIVQLTEDVLQAKGIQCDASISKIPEEELKEILEKVREPRKKRRKNNQVQKLLNKKTVTYTRAGDKMDTTTRSLSMLGIGTLWCGISLFVVTILIRTIIVFFIIGVPLVALWLYVVRIPNTRRRSILILASPHNVNMKKQRPASGKTVHAAF
jgi:Flp pilus assembly protein TadB